MCTGEVGTQDWRSKPWQDCYVYRCHSIWILTHILEIRTHIFNAIEIVDGHLAHERNEIGKVGNAKLCLPNHILFRDADWFKCHFRQLYFKADSSEIHFLYTPLFSHRLKTCRAWSPNFSWFFFFPVRHLKEWTLLKWLKLKGLDFFDFLLRIMYQMTVNVKIVKMEHLRCDVLLFCFVFEKTVATEYS